MAQRAAAFVDPWAGGLPVAGGSRAALNRPGEPLAPRQRARFAAEIDLSSDGDDVLPAPKRRRVGRAGVGAGAGGGGGLELRAGQGKGKGKADAAGAGAIDLSGGGKGKSVQLNLDFEDDDGDLVFDDVPAKLAPAPLASGSGAAHSSSGDGAPSGAVDYGESVATICSILPDVLPSYVEGLLKLPMYGPGNVELVMEALFSAEGAYPKREEGGVSSGSAAGKGKEKAVEVEDVKDEGEEDAEIERKAKAWVDTSGRKPLGKAYEDVALAQLYVDFPRFQQANIKKLWVASSSFYVPTYLACEKAMKQTDAERGFKLMGSSSRGRAAKGKGKADEEFERERKWVVEEMPRYRALQARIAAKEKALEDEIASGAFVECGCCFTDCALSQMVTCDAGCEFCADCARMNAESQIGMRKYLLPCMSTSGCKSFFSEREAERFLSRKTLNALHKIRMEKEVDAAAIEGLEQCPFCPFAYIIENPDERLFHCQREDCKIVSCRQCKKKDHLPKTCREVDNDAVISTVHRVEEAMTEALLRRCPKEGCGEPFIKEQGTCNKITCSSCRTLSCYICKQIIKDYSHFRNAGSNAPGGGNSKSTCDLWDDTDSRNFQEVEAARIAAEAEARKANPGVTDEDLKKLAMAKPGAPPQIIAHMPAPRIAAYEALVGAPVPGAARAAPAPRRVDDGGYAARLAAAQAAADAARRVAEAQAAAAMGAGVAARYGAGAARIPPPAPVAPFAYPAAPAPAAGPAALNARNLAALQRQRNVEAAAADPAAVERRWAEAQERKRQAEQMRERMEQERRDRLEQGRKKRKAQEDARAARRARTGGGK
ncbi:hypothetical protein JCM10213_001211 [Rhodosporidiobolus nylandii]